MGTSSGATRTRGHCFRQSPQAPSVLTSTTLPIAPNSSMVSSPLIHRIHCVAFSREKKWVILIFTAPALQPAKLRHLLLFAMDALTLLVPLTTNPTTGNKVHYEKNTPTAFILFCIRGNGLLPKAVAHSKVVGCTSTSLFMSQKTTWASSFTLPRSLQKKASSSNPFFSMRLANLSSMPIGQINEKVRFLGKCYSRQVYLPDGTTFPSGSGTANDKPSAFYYKLLWRYTTIRKPLLRKPVSQQEPSRQTAPGCHS